MKASVLSLFVAAAAFGGSSLYFWQQLQGERARADELAVKSAELNARIAQLEQARGQFAQRSFAGASTFGGRAALAGPGQPPPPEAVDGKGEAKVETPWSVRPSPERTAAMQKMMRPQIRANNKRLYADVGAALGLGKDEAAKLIDLLTDQQLAQFGPRDLRDPDDEANYWENLQREQKTQLADLLGPDKVASLEEYQKSLPARQELDMLARQFEGYDVPLNDDQRKRMITIMSEERERVPPPNYTEGMDMAEMQKLQLAWEADYNERVMSQARSVLNTAQVGALTEYQQAQQDMRSQFSVAGMAPARVQGRMLRGVRGGNVSFVTTAPVGSYVQAEIVNGAPPPPPADKK
jgi:outer membrane murein-binding lipoprotein Lpp